MLNWIDKNERLPTKEDANESGCVYALCGSDVKLFHYNNAVATCVAGSFTHWLPFREMPIPKRWRTPTIHDLAKAGKPIPCRYKEQNSAAWEESSLFAIHLGNCLSPFLTSDHWKRYCEICDE